MTEADILANNTNLLDDDIKRLLIEINKEIIELKNKRANLANHTDSNSAKKRRIYSAEINRRQRITKHLRNILKLRGETK